MCSRPPLQLPPLPANILRRPTRPRKLTRSVRRINFWPSNSFWHGRFLPLPHDESLLLERLECALLHKRRKEPEALQETAFNSQEVQELSKNSLDFLAALAMPVVLNTFSPSFQGYLGLAAFLRPQSKRLFSTCHWPPRGFGKTMLIKIFVLYCVLFTKKSFILIICGTQTKANNILADIQSMLDEPNIKKVFGDWRIGLTIDRQDIKEFGFRGRKILLMGAGAQSDIRGSTRNNIRPDVMVFDDIQTREEADSQEVSTKLDTWMIGTAMKAKGPEGCLFIFIANMYPTRTLSFASSSATPLGTSSLLAASLPTELPLGGSATH